MVSTSLTNGISYGTEIQPKNKVSYTHTILTIALLGSSLE
jgi:hypothetical protein